MYTCHSNRAKCRCGTKAWAQPLRSLPPCTYTPQNTRMASSAPLPSPVCGCFSAYTYVSALRRYQACLMQWTCISISAGQTQINRNVLKKKCFKQIPLQVRQRKRGSTADKWANFPCMEVNEDLFNEDSKAREERKVCMDAYSLFFLFSSGFGQVTPILSHEARWWKYQKTSQWIFILILGVVFWG